MGPAAGNGNGSEQLAVHADLLIEVDGHQARLTGSGSEIRLESDTPLALWSAFSGSALPSGVGKLSGPRAVGRLADQLAQHGLQFSVAGPAGELVRLGSASRSTLGRLTTGSRAIQLGSVRAVGPLALAWVRQTGAGLLRRVRRR